MAKSFTERKRIRKDFGRIRAVAPMPNLIEVQKSSYDAFLQIHTQVEDRNNSGLQEVFKSSMDIVRPQATSKDLKMQLQVGPDFPVYVKGEVGIDID